MVRGRFLVLQPFNPIPGAGAGKAPVEPSQRKKSLQEILSSSQVLIFCLLWIFVIDSSIFNVELKCNLSQILSSLVPP